MNIPATPLAGHPAAPGDGRSARWDAHRQSRKLALVKAARKAVHRLGPAASMEDLATAAGTSKSVFYRYFGDKDGLRRAMGEIVVGTMRERIMSAMQDASSQAEGLGSMVGAYLSMAETSPNVYFFVTSTDRESPGGTADPLDHFLAELTSMMAGHMRGYLAGHPGHGAPDTDLEFWPRAALGMVRTTGEAWLRMPADRSRPTRDELTAALLRWLVHGIAAEGAAGPADTDSAERSSSAHRPERKATQ
ncbi:TetR/AcrR family transcriptional regulator [Zafaria sp. Z1313]|uniref:TetR/AcrR family transcriptional regulator n=1 Tax=unclassified Zafaria TaxID=2828765 RepID=UPI002E79EBF7|nr:helix-turn-helix domain-containing protein [Zafaria sp. J156]MEE1621231.1 helix-turn-helix domain-containing protein [Zafaria sp. J156]